MCAVAVLEAKFVNIAERSPVDVGKIPLQRFRLVRNLWDSLLGLLVSLKSYLWVFSSAPEGGNFLLLTGGQRKSKLKWVDC